MPFRAFSVEPRWTLERGETMSRVTCEIALMLDDESDEGAYETRLSLNGQLFYQVLFRTSQDAKGDASDALRGLLDAGWVRDMVPVSPAECSRRFITGC